MAVKVEGLVSFIIFLEYFLILLMEDDKANVLMYLVISNIFRNI